jgi:hypothetical protein
MSFLSHFKKVFNREKHLTVSFYLTGGNRVDVTGVKKLETTRAPDGSFASYTIEWHPGQQPAFTSFALNHITAITAYKD